MSIDVKSLLFKPQDLSSRIGRHADIGIGLILLVIMALLVFPVPGFLLDLAIAMNFCFAVLLLTSAIYIKSALELSTFPSLLLLTTLFRLGLAVATTKMILLHAYAGDIIHAFGNLVVGGNVVVGLVVFAVLCVVQFIVIAKGSDRVAEVAARFTLDAIPGKQMSIDADLRAGTLTGAQAKERRDTLQREIQLHGAMDGAMKFVKGDAVVGLLIALVNIIGGIVIGVVMKGMPMGEAARTYVVLTVGDGLVSQIPSLIVSISAGLIITRGENGGGHADDNLGRRIFDQVATKANAMFMASAGAAALGLVPGFPHVAFFCIAATLLVLALSLRGRDTQVARSRHAPMVNMTRDGASYVMNILDEVEMGTVSPLRIRIGEEAFGCLHPPAFDAELAIMRERIAKDNGVPFPGLSMSGERSLSPDSFCIEVDGRLVAQGNLHAGRVFAFGQLERMDVDSLDVPGFVPRLGDGFWVPLQQASQFDETGVSALDANAVLAEHLYDVTLSHAKAFIGTQESKYLLDKLAVLFPDLVEEVKQSVPLIVLSEMLRGLLEEGVAIRNMRAICEAITKTAPNRRTYGNLLRQVRRSLGRQICASHLDAESSTLRIALLDDALTSYLSQSLVDDELGDAQLVLDAQSLQRMDATFRHGMDDLALPGVLVTAPPLRSHVADLVRGVGATLPVLSMDEIPFGEIEIQRIGSIALAPERRP
ncbi:flagellar biosynthesis protein FlhA [Dyella sp.]|uniref:flagellar biosynthesis protein FlhA n=1 Tax=Dyella sp. TaxID=1869338 RepID=UPI002ED57FB8